MKINLTTIITALGLAAILAIPTVADAFQQDFYSFDAYNAQQNVRDNADKIDTVLPQSYVFGKNLRLTRNSDGSVHQAAEDNDVKIIPLVYQTDFDRVLMSVILNIPKIQDIMITQMILEAESQNYDGWQYDFENIAPGDKDLYTDFVRRSAEAFDDADLEFSVAIVPRQNDYIPGVSDPNWSVAYDLEEIAKVADYVTLMAYDDPLSVGPTASLPFAKKTIEYALTKAPAEKLSLGVPLYCWKWQLNDGPYRRKNSITQPLNQEDQDEALISIKKYNQTLESEMYIFIPQSRNVLMTWCDGEQGFEKKLDLVEEYDLRGISAWAIGQETEDIWQHLERK